MITTIQMTSVFESKLNPKVLQKLLLIHYIPRYRPVLRLYICPRIFRVFQGSSVIACVRPKFLCLFAALSAFIWALPASTFSLFTFTNLFSLSAALVATFARKSA